MSLLRVWQQLNLGQKITTVTLSFAVIVATALLVIWASTPTYGVLFSGLSSADGNAIVTQLNSAKVAYQLQNGGGTILVPQNMVDTERLAMAGQGLPQSGTVGYAIFDKQNILQGDSFTEQVNLTRALEGELGTTIGTINGVTYDRVSVVMPQQSLFTSSQASATASVLLKMSPGAALTADQIAGIQHLVASSVQGLKPEEVTVVDGTGNILSSNNGSTAGTSSLGTTALQAQSQYASNLEAQLTAMLDTVVGPDKAVVRVNDTMNWTQSDATASIFNPQSKFSPLTESKVVSSTTLGAGATVGGIAGLASNVPTYSSISGTTLGGAGQTGALQASSDLMFANSNTITHTIAAPGQVTSLSVSVLLNGVTNPATLASLRQAIASSVGLSVARGDQLTVANVPFDQSVSKLAIKDAAAQQSQQLMMNIVRWGSLIVVPLFLLFLFRRTLRTTRVIDPFDQTALLNGQSRAMQISQPAREEERIVLAEPPMSATQRSVSELARDKPDVVAGLIGKWIEEDR